MSSTNFFKNIGILLGGQASISIMGFLSLAIMSNAYGVSALGLFATSLATASVLEGLTKAGYNVAHLKRIADGLPLTRAIGVYSSIKFTLAILFIITSMILASVLIPSMDDIDQDKATQLTNLFIAMMAARCFADIFLQSFMGLKETKKVVTCQFSGALTRLCAVIYAVLTDQNIAFIAVGYIISEIVISVVGLILKGNSFKISSITYRKEGDIRSYNKIAAPMSLIALTSGIEKHLDTILIALWLGPVAAGVYYGCQRILQFFPIIGTTLANYYIPSMSMDLKTISIKDAVLTTQEYQRKILVVMIFVFTVGALSSSLIASSLSLPEQDFSIVFIMLLAANIFTLTLTPLTELFTTVGHFATRVIISVTLRGAYFLALIICVPDQIFGSSMLALGLVGAGVAKLIQAATHWLVLRVCTSNLVKRNN